MKKLPLGIQNFKKIIEGDYIYADKTQYVYNLIHDASYYFLSRPRRFGKSLLLDTIAEAFSGDKELFRGLYLYESGYSFEQHPVLRLDMSNIANKTPENLEESLCVELRTRIFQEGFSIDSRLPSDILKNLIESLYTKYNRKIVVLIDEYDLPILDHIDDIKTAEANRQVLKNFYGVLKSMDPCLRFIFITGVSKFTKTSIFSELNNLFDITLTKKYSNICGINAENFDQLFKPYIDDLAFQEGFCDYNITRDKILAWYDGYSWDGETKVINPFSLLSFFAQKRFSNYWYASGTPAFLIKLIKNNPSAFLSLNNLEISERTLDSFDIRKMSAASLLFQTGYLTVADKIMRGDTENYILEMPNREVSEAFNLNIITDFTGNEESFTETAYWRMKDSLATGNLDDMLVLLKSIFASIPYYLHVNREAYYHSIFYASMIILGFHIYAEVPVSGGRIDAVLELDNFVYILEFKYVNYLKQRSGSAEKKNILSSALAEGMDQIKAKGYANKFVGGGKTIYLAVFAFLGRDDINMAVEVIGREHKQSL